MFAIRSLGCDATHGSDFHAYMPSGWDCYMILFVKTPALFIFGEESTYTQPGTFVLFNKSTPLNYRAVTDRYIDDWIHFKGEDALVHSLGIPFDKPVFIGNGVPIADFFKLMTASFMTENSYRHITCSLLLNSLLTSVSGFLCIDYKLRSYYGQLLELRRDIFSHPEKKWSNPIMAERLNVSNAHFQELYKLTFGISVGADVIRMRVSAAQNLLTNTNLPIREVASSCGYSNEIHFSRQFRQMTGFTPSDYRKHGGKIERYPLIDI